MSLGLSPQARPSVALPGGRFAGSWLAAISAADRRGEISRLPLRSELSTPVDGRAFRLFAETAADLPGWARSDRASVVFEGRLHERGELRRLLGDAAAEARCDAELALLAFERWGDELPARLRGEFALLVWQAAEQRLLALRDRMGHRPLFYAVAGNELILATSPALVALHPRVSTELHRAAMAEMLCFRFLDQRETSYAHILRVPPGQRLDWRPGGEPRLNRYWTPRFGDYLDSRDVPERFAEVFDRAVARSLEVGSPAIFLSGGLDSANVTLTATDQLRAAGAPPPLALSLAFPQEVDEVEIQTGVADQLGLEQVLMPFWEAAGHERTLLRVAELSRDWPVPLINLWRPSYLRLGEEAVRRGRQSILTGHGGDEWLDAGIDYAAELIRRGNLVELYRLWRMARRSYSTSAPIMARNLFWRYGARPLLVGTAMKALGPLTPRLLASRRRKFAAATTPEFLAPDPALRRALDERAEAMLPAPRHGSSYLGQVPLYFASTIGPLLQEDNFEACRRLGIPMLSPFLDPEVIEFACRVRAEDLYDGGRNKGLLRQRAVPRLPQLGFDRQMKLPATSFMRRIVREQTDGAWNELGGVPRLAELGIVDPTKLRKTLDEVVAGTMARASNLSVFAFSLESWAQARA